MSDCTNTYTLSTKAKKTKPQTCLQVRVCVHTCSRVVVILSGVSFPSVCLHGMWLWKTSKDSEVACQWLEGQASRALSDPMPPVPRPTAQAHTHARASTQRKNRTASSPAGCGSQIF